MGTGGHCRGPGPLTPILPPLVGPPTVPEGSHFPQPSSGLKEGTAPSPPQDSPGPSALAFLSSDPWGWTKMGGTVGAGCQETRASWQLPMPSAGTLDRDPELQAGQWLEGLRREIGVSRPQVHQALTDGPLLPA